MSKYKRYYKDAVVVNGQLCKCSPEVASLCNQSDWVIAYQERKRRTPVTSKSGFDDLASSRECSLEEMLSHGITPSASRTDGFEDDVLQRMTNQTRLEILCKKLLPKLTEEEKLLLSSVTNNISSREFERMYGIPRKTFLYRLKKLLEKLRNEIEKEEKTVKGKEA